MVIGRFLNLKMIPNHETLNSFNFVKELFSISIKVSCLHNQKTIVIIDFIPTVVQSREPPGNKDSRVTTTTGSRCVGQSTVRRTYNIAGSRLVEAAQDLSYGILRVLIPINAQLWPSIGSLC